MALLWSEVACGVMGGPYEPKNAPSDQPPLAPSTIPPLPENTPHPLLPCIAPSPSNPHDHDGGGVTPRFPCGMGWAKGGGGSYALLEAESSAKSLGF